MNMQTGAWGFWESVPIFGADSWSGSYMMGGPRGVVYINDGNLDGAEIAKPNYFQNVPNPTPSAEWSVPIPLEFKCDGSQITGTAYQVDISTPLTVGIPYRVSYRIEANALVNEFQDVPTVPPGSEWRAFFGEFNCSSAQFAETAYQTTLVSALKVGIRYQITFKTKDYIGGNFKFKAGDEDIIAYSSGNGSWSAEITPTVPINTVSMVGDSNFQGTFYDVIVGYYDGAGQHSLRVGNDIVAPANTGSGSFSATDDSWNTNILYVNTLAFSRPHVLNGYVDYRMDMGGMIDQIGLNLSFNQQSGLPYSTYAAAAFAFNERSPSTLDTKLKAELKLTFGPVSPTVFLLIDNLLNRENVVAIADPTTYFDESESNYQNAAGPRNNLAAYGAPMTIHFGFSVGL
jgi:hypothetical protein